jgi:hypothetical protein
VWVELRKDCSFELGKENASDDVVLRAGKVVREFLKFRWFCNKDVIVAEARFLRIRR